MKLKDYIYETRLSPRAWAKLHGISKDAVYRHIKGKRVDYVTAKKISEAAAGAVTISEIMD